VNWLLTTILLMPNGEVVTTRAGNMVSEDVCITAGEGIGQMVAFQNPEIQYFYTCKREISL
jgi:hypothetical protein